jgi:hypothetical protein
MHRVPLIIHPPPHRTFTIFTASSTASTPSAAIVHTALRAVRFVDGRQRDEMSTELREARLCKLKRLRYQLLFLLLMPLTLPILPILPTLERRRVKIIEGRVGTEPALHQLQLVQRPTRTRCCCRPHATHTAHIIHAALLEVGCFVVIFVVGLDLHRREGMFKELPQLCPLPITPFKQVQYHTQ